MFLFFGNCSQTGKNPGFRILFRIFESVLVLTFLANSKNAHDLKKCLRFEIIF